MKLHPLVWMGVAFFVVCQPLDPKGLIHSFSSQVCAAAGQWQRSLLLLQACHPEPWFSWFIMIKKKAMIRLVLVFPYEVKAHSIKYIPNGTLYWIFTACLNRLMFAGGYGSRWSFSKCGHIWKRSCCFAKRGSLATCPTAVGESTRSKGTGVFWEIEILTAFPFFSIRNSLEKAKLIPSRLLCGYLWGVYIAGWMKLWWYWMLHVDAQWGQITKLSAISDHTLDGQECGWPVYLQIFPNWCKVSAINNIKPGDLKLEIVGVLFSSETGCYLILST